METKRILEGPEGMLIEEDFTTHKHPPKEIRDARREKAAQADAGKGADAAKALDAGSPADAEHGKKSGAKNHLLFHQWKPEDDGDDDDA